MKLPKELTTVTRLSKTLALIMFIALPIIAFIFGANYQKFLEENKVITLTPTPIPIEGIACTMDAKICPDGSSVGRLAPDCEFAPCPPKVEVKYWCGEMAGNKPCPEGYACKYQSPSVKSGICERCPEVEYVDCVPGPDKFDSRCSPEYLDWATDNCPKFKGAIY